MRRDSPLDFAGCWSGESWKHLFHELRASMPYPHPSASRGNACWQAAWKQQGCGPVAAHSAAGYHLLTEQAQKQAGHSHGTCQDSQADLKKVSLFIGACCCYRITIQGDLLWCAAASSLRRLWVCLCSFRFGRQEDAHEYLVALLDAMHESYLNMCRPKPSPELSQTSMIYRIFAGRIRSQVSFPSYTCTPAAAVHVHKSMLARLDCC